MLNEIYQDNRILLLFEIKFLVKMMNEILPEKSTFLSSNVQA